MLCLRLFPPCLSEFNIINPPDMEGRVEMTVSRVHQTKQTVDWDENLLNRDTEEQEGEGDSNESVEHAEQFTRSAERSLLSISNGGDHSSREEE